MGHCFGLDWKKRFQEFLLNQIKGLRQSDIYVRKLLKRPYDADNMRKHKTMKKKRKKIEERDVMAAVAVFHAARTERFFRAFSGANRGVGHHTCMMLRAPLDLAASASALAAAAAAAAAAVLLRMRLYVPGRSIIDP